jgi:DNA-binding NarL/FixJ family response regulator
MHNKPAVVIVANPGRLREGLQAVVESLPKVNLIGMVDEGAALLQASTGASGVLVLIDAALPNGEAWILRDRIRIRFPAMHCLLLVNDRRQRRLAQLVGAPAIEFSNLSSTLLKGAISHLFPEMDSLEFPA